MHPVYDLLGLDDYWLWAWSSGSNSLS